MKKKIFNSVSALAIVGLMVLNAHVVFSDQAPNFLKWDVIGSILAQNDSISSGLLKMYKEDSPICETLEIDGETYYYYETNCWSGDEDMFCEEEDCPV